MEDRFDVDLTVFGETTRFGVWRYTGTDIERWRAAALKPGPDGTYESVAYASFEQQLTPHDALGKAVARMVGHVLGDRFAVTQRAANRENRSTEAMTEAPVGTATSVQDVTSPPEPVAFPDREERAAGLAATIDAAIGRLDEQLRAGHTAEFLEVLRFYARFHRYSVNNMLLIRAQKPDATRVAGLRTWGELGYTVRKGEKAIWVWCPITKREPDPATGELVEAVVGFRPGAVFDAGQLKEIGEKPLPEVFRPLPDDCEELYRQVESRIAASGIAVEERLLPPGVQGVSRGGTILIKPGFDSRNRLFVLLHEVAHELAHQGPQQQGKPAAQRELEAESVAFVVASVLGLEIPTSRDYLLNWDGTPEQLKASMGTIQALVRRVVAIARPDERRGSATGFADRAAA